MQLRISIIVRRCGRVERASSLPNGRRRDAESQSRPAQTAPSGELSAGTKQRALRAESCQNIITDFCGLNQCKWRQLAPFEREAGNVDGRT